MATSSSWAGGGNQPAGDLTADRLGVMGVDGGPQTLESDVEVLSPSLDEPVGVKEHERTPGAGSRSQSHVRTNGLVPGAARWAHQ